MKKIGDAMNEKSVYIPLRLDFETTRLLDAVCGGQGDTRSEVIRGFIIRGLKADGYQVDDDRIYQTTKAALKEILDPTVKRLAAISAKNAQMAGADYVMLIYLAKLLVGHEDMQQIDNMSEQARLAGIELLKAKDHRMEDILKKAVRDTEDYI